MKVMSKIKIVWVCHFSNAEVREKLPLTDEGKCVADYAIWITNLIEEFKNIKDIELHIISPHYGIKVLRHYYENSGIHYHFYCAQLPVKNKYILFAFDKVCRGTQYINSKVIVKNIVNRIKPDIINLMGAENPYYSSAILWLKKYPRLITIQGIYSNEKRFGYIKKDKIRYIIERKIHKENNYYGINASFMEVLIKRDSEKAVIMWSRFPFKIANIDKKEKIEKIYDFVLFSRLTPLKGTEDALKAMAIVKKHIPNVSLRMMGPAEERYIKKLNQLAKDLDLEQNVNISNGYQDHDELLREALKGKYYLLPTKLDTIPNTILESIFLGLPVISYDTGDINILNKGDLRVLLSECNNIESLANNMLKMITDPEWSIQLSVKAKKFLEKNFNSRYLALNFVEQYKAILDNYYNSKQIPENLLYKNYLKDYE
jgi:glycosyltransferase involved in cell wall biosynthesis